VTGKLIEFDVDGGARKTSGYLAIPPDGSGPGLVLIQEWWGLVDHIIELAERFASEGFVVLAPDLYHGRKTKSPDEAGKLLMALNISEAAKDIIGASKFLQASASVSPKKVGALGFCMGGQLALFAAIEYPQDIHAAVDFYGIHPRVEIKPERLEVPVLLHFGKKDKSIPEAEARELVARLQGAGGPVEGYFYEAGHAFFNDTRPEAYVEADARIAWNRSLAFLRTHLV
jgi:carboxymethylenebutenolidase